jgi:E3 ubiquitin-protein ligase HUWE1
MYVFFGKLLGKALLEGLLLNVRLSIPLLKHVLGVPLKLSDLYLLDETVYRSMIWILENDNTNALGLNFTVEGAELIPSGADVTLHDGNKQLYVAKVAQYYLFDSVREEISSIMEGLRSVITDTVLHVFDFKELDLLLSGLPQIDVNDWRQHTDVRFIEQSTLEFELIGWFWEILESFSQDQRGRLLQYVTGSSGVPVEGFKVFVADVELKISCCPDALCCDHGHRVSMVWMVKFSFSPSSLGNTFRLSTRYFHTQAHA